VGTKLFSVSHRHAACGNLIDKYVYHEFENIDEKGYSLFPLDIGKVIEQERIKLKTTLRPSFNEDDGVGDLQVMLL